MIFFYQAILLFLFVPILDSVESLKKSAHSTCIQVILAETYMTSLTFINHLPDLQHYYHKKDLLMLISKSNEIDY